MWAGFPKLLTATAEFTASGGFSGRAYDNITTVHPLGLALLIISFLAILLSRRERAILPFFVMACAVSCAQRIVIGGVDFDFTRILVIAGILRILVRQEWKIVHFQWLDGVVLAWAISKLLFHNLLWMRPEVLQRDLGVFLDTAVMYLIFRVFVNSSEDLLRIGKLFAFLVVPVAMVFAFEYVTARNLFSIFGGVPEITVERQGKLRCQGPFAHPIVAGCFWAAILPTILALWKTGYTGRVLSGVGFCGSLVVIAACSSSTPLFGVLMVFVGLSYWHFRFAVKPTLWSIAILIPILHMVMEGPVWHLISRVSAVGGSTGYHRYMLIDQAIKRFPEWALFGTKSTLHWGHFLFDVANNYVVQGVVGGISTLILFILILVVAFRNIGAILRTPSTKVSSSREFTVWCLGVSLMVHCANFIGLAYFGQVSILLYFHLAAVASLLQTSASVDDSESLQGYNVVNLQNASEPNANDSMEQPK